MPMMAPRHCPRCKALVVAPCVTCNRQNCEVRPPRPVGQTYARWSAERDDLPADYFRSNELAR
jgi:hypothetical protein